MPHFSVFFFWALALVAAQLGALSENLIRLPDVSRPQADCHHQFIPNDMEKTGGTNPVTLN